MARRYLRDFVFRAAVFLMILGIYLYDRSLLDITRREHSQIFPQTTGTTTIICDSDNGR